MGAVWTARHEELGVEMAVKFQSADAALDPRAELRFRREARAAAQLKSPHVVQIHDFGIDGSTPYLVMELLQGEDLADLLQREGALSAERTLALVRQACKALGRAHHAGIVHRDIKPGNLFLVRDGEDEVLKVLDFGIARHVEATGDDVTTSVGMVLGSPAYMSPEQARGAAVDHRSDLWSLAAVAYRMLSGAAPFTGNNSQDIIIKICTESVPALSRSGADLGASVDLFFERALSKNPGARFQSAEAFADAFERAVRQVPQPSSTSSTPHPAIGRTTPTESLSVPAGVSQAPRPLADGRSAARRWVVAAAAVIVVLLLVGHFFRGTEAGSPGPTSSAGSTGAPEGAASAPSAGSFHVQAVPERGPEQGVGDGVSANPPPSRRPRTGASASPLAVPRPRPEASANPPAGRPQTEAPTDPVFGLPVPSTQSPVHR